MFCNMEKLVGTQGLRFSKFDMKVICYFYAKKQERIGT